MPGLVLFLHLDSDLTILPMLAVPATQLIKGKNAASQLGQCPVTGVRDQKSGIRGQESGVRGQPPAHRGLRPGGKSEEGLLKLCPVTSDC